MVSDNYKGWIVAAVTWLGMVHAWSDPHGQWSPVFQPPPAGFHQGRFLGTQFAPRGLRNRPVQQGLMWRTESNAFAPTRGQLSGLSGERFTTPTAQARLKLGVPLTQNDPGLSALKAGPVFLKLDDIRTRVAFTDFDSAFIDPPEDDGWISIWELSGRAFLEFSDDFYLTVAGSLYYLPLEGEVGIDLGAASRSFARLDWFGHLGSWDLHAFDEFRVYHRATDLLDPFEVDEIDRAGRYRFGQRDDTFRSNQFLDDEFLVFSNLLSAQASTLVSSRNRLSLTYQREDYWQSMDFGDHRERDRFEIRLENEGSIPFSPYLSYLATTSDRWGAARHRLWHGGHGRLTESLRVSGRVGYQWYTGDSKHDGQRFLYEAGLVHDINATTKHSLYGGHIVAENRFGDEGLFKYLRYTLAHEALNGISLRAFASVYDRDEPTEDSDHTRWLFGAGARIPLGDRTNLRVYSRHEITERPKERDANRWIHGAILSRQLTSRLHADLHYRYEDYRRPGGSFSEHYAGLGLTFTF